MVFKTVIIMRVNRLMYKESKYFRKTLTQYLEKRKYKTQFTEIKHLISILIQVIFLLKAFV